MSIAIQVLNLSKAYQLGEIGTGSLSRDLERWFAKIRGKEDPYLQVGQENDRTKKGTSDVVWSLKDINFEIEQGSAVGIIGRNGAGKSTLLKLLSRVTSPTTGEINVKGRIASLLEVGTGFHPELSGRENIFLNGAILGMRKKEIQGKFDEIVDFSGVERYIDTPVKRYSSGMYVRLAFAVAAYLESEILIVDEVLAVGDAEFQKKCLGKMGDISKGEGRTVFFVSHQMGSIAQLCSSCMYLHQGKLLKYGKTDQIIDQYINQGRSEIGATYRRKSEPNQNIFIQSASVVDKEHKEENIFRHDEPITIKVVGFIKKWIFNPELRLVLKEHRHLKVFTTDIELNDLSKKDGVFTAVFTIPPNVLRPTTFTVSLDLHVLHQYYIERVEDALTFSVFDGGSRYASSEGSDYGVVFSPCSTSLIQS
jgi:lipopolysaccharide transport system ATP-binding protein